MPSTSSAKILHIITGLGMGGAEMVLYHLLASQDPGEFENRVVSLTTAGPVAGLISAQQIQVNALGGRRGLAAPRLLTGLVRLMRAFKPDLVQTWMYHADLAGGLAARMAGSPPVVWGLHHSVAESRALKPATMLVARLNAWLSRALPIQVVCCAEATRRSHIRLGYLESRMVVIPNGIDPREFRPDPCARREVRQELGLDDHTPLVGLCARLDPQKDHQNFLRAAGLLSAERPDLHYVLWGTGVEPGNKMLDGWIQAARIGAKIHLLGLRRDSARLMAALDLACLSSAFGEALPLAVGEAMACEVPCVVTDVGDSARIVGDTGRVVVRRDPISLAGALGDLLSLSDMDRRRLGAQARQRILDSYSLEGMVRAYSQLYRDIITRGDRP